MEHSSISMWYQMEEKIACTSDSAEESEGNREEQCFADSVTAIATMVTCH
jgi:hypothetical protein